VTDNRQRAFTESAFAKVNLCLFLGPMRSDGRHELVTLFQSTEFADELLISRLPSGEDEVICPAVTGQNLVARALAELRVSGWSAPPLRVVIQKRIPLAAGMGGGSADAAAMLRCAPRLAPVTDATLLAIAVRLGADVPAQLHPGSSIGTGAGEIVEPVSVADHGVLVLPQPFFLHTPDVYREADRLGLPRAAAEVAALQRDVVSALAGGPAEPSAPEPSAPGPVAPGPGAPGPLPEPLIVNDLQPAALSLRPEIADTLAVALGAGADHAILCGSGPTVVGIFGGAGGPDRAREALDHVQTGYPRAVATRPVRGGVPGRTPNV
jgi:4-diphosphocytidyl-2-C-methyl-D-erythritol kinase